MAKVPYQPVPTVSPDQVATPYNSGAGNSPDAFGAGIGRGLEHVGAATEQFANVLKENAIRLQERENQATATDLLVKADIEAATIKAEYNSLEGKAAKDALPGYMDKLNELREKYVSQSPNMEVRRQFDSDFKRRVGYMVSDGAGYAAGQIKRYTTDADKARIGLATKGAAEAAFTGNDVQFQDSLNIAKSAADALSTSNGEPLDSPAAELRRANTKSAVWSAGLERLAQRNPELALLKFRENRAQMSGDAQEKVYHQIIGNFTSVQSRIDADRITNGADGLIHQRRVSPKVRTDQLDPEFQTRLNAIVSAAEAATGEKVSILSATRTTAEQAEIYQRSGGGTRFMAAPPGMSRHEVGAAVDLRVGKALDWIREHVDEYGLEKLSMKDPGHIQMAREAIGTRGTPMTAKTPESRLPEFYDQAEKRASELFPDDPGARQRYQDSLVDRINTKYNMQKKVVRENEALKTLSIGTEITDKGVTGFEQLSPAAQQAYRELPPNRQASADKAMARNAKGDVPQTPERIARFNEVMGQAITNPDQFMAANPMELDLTNAQKNQVYKRQRDILGKVTDATGFANAMKNVHIKLNDAGIFASRADPSANRQMDAFQGAFWVERKQWMEENKKVPTPEEDRQIASRLLAENPGSFFGLLSGGRKYEVPSSWETPDRSVTQDEVIELFKQRKGRPPTPAEIYTIYQQSKK